MHLNWGGKKYRPIQGIKKYEPDINELIKPLSEKPTKGTIFLMAQALNAPAKIIPSPTPSVDPDAQAFFDAITSSGGTLNSTEQNAINDFVVDLKSYNLWNKMIAIYPVVSSGSTVQSFNLKDPTQYNLTFNGSWSHTNAGADPSGGYAQTGIIPSVIDFQTLGSIHYSMYITENFASGGYDMGCVNNFQDWGLISSFLGNNIAYIGVGTGWVTVSNGGSTKSNWLMTNDGSTSYIYKDATLLKSEARTLASGSIYEMYISAFNNTGSVDNPSSRSWALASIGLGLDATEASNFNTAVVDYQTALSRQN